jgi:hypothetical protein
VTGGAILERCNSIAFTVVVDVDGGSFDGNDDGHENAGDEFCKLLDVKDFSFLKRGVPSPNFTVRYMFCRKLGGAGGDDDYHQTERCQPSVASTPSPHFEYEQTRSQASEESHSFGGSVVINTHLEQKDDDNVSDDDEI